jgi:hypothetical protein
MPAEPDADDIIWDGASEDGGGGRWVTVDGGRLGNNEARSTVGVDTKVTFDASGISLNVCSEYISN